MPAIRDELEQALYALTMEHLAKLAAYMPGQGQRTLNLIKSKDFRQEVGAVAAAEHFATEAVVDRMSFE